MKTLLGGLDERGFIAQVSDNKLDEVLESKSITLYVGFDPTATSLHLGHLLPIMGMAHFQKAGHRVIIVVGGATGMVGDPSGKSDERNLLSPEQVAENVSAVKEQLKKFLDFDGDNPANMLDNYEWISGMSFIDWLRDVGKYFRVNHMLAKESVRKRIESEEGISFTEFSYMTMQAYDFLYLNKEYGCVLQAGGNDQWGNIVAGVELIRRVCGAEAYALTFPLITTSTGEKFGKTAGNAVWLDPKLTSPYAFYQFWIQIGDEDVKQYLKYFTFVDTKEIEALCEKHSEHPESRIAQRKLAEEVTRLVHDDSGLKRAQRASEILFGAEIKGLVDGELLEIFGDVPSAVLSSSSLNENTLLVDALVDTGIVTSRGEARRLIQNGGLNVNNRRVSDSDIILSHDMLASETILVVRKGKKNYSLIRFE